MINYTQRHIGIIQGIVDKLENTLKELKTSYAKTFSINYRIINLYSHQNISYVSLSALNLNSLYVDISVNLHLVSNSENDSTVVLKRSYCVENNFSHDSEVSDIEEFKNVFKNDINRYYTIVLDDLFNSIKLQTQKILDMCDSEDFYNLRNNLVLEDVHKLIYDIMIS